MNFRFLYVNVVEEKKRLRLITCYFMKEGKLESVYAVAHGERTVSLSKVVCEIINLV